MAPQHNPRAIACIFLSLVIRLSSLQGEPMQRILKSAVSLLALLSFSTSAFPQTHFRTDAEEDDLRGPVKFVTSTVEWNPAISFLDDRNADELFDFPCDSCEYTRDGFLIRRGVLKETASPVQVDERETTELSRDANGQVFQRSVYSVMPQRVIRIETLGPFGPTEIRDLGAGDQSLARETYAYDTKGRITDNAKYGVHGELESEEYDSFDDRNGREEMRYVDLEDGASYLQVTDHLLHTISFTSFGADGAEDASWTSKDGQIRSFWMSPVVTEGNKSAAESMSFDMDNGNEDSLNCERETGCSVTLRLHREYIDDDTSLPTRIESTDPANPANNRVMEIEYVFDAHRNWTLRRKYVTSAALGTHTLLRTEVRTITYYAD
jgi:hypothetical protein